MESQSVQKHQKPWLGVMSIDGTYYDLNLQGREVHGFHWNTMKYGSDGSKKVLKLSVI